MGDAPLYRLLPETYGLVLNKNAWTSDYLHKGEAGIHWDLKLRRNLQYWEVSPYLDLITKQHYTLGRMTGGIGIGNIMKIILSNLIKWCSQRKQQQEFFNPMKERITSHTKEYKIHWFHLGGLSLLGGCMWGGNKQ